MYNQIEFETYISMTVDNDDDTEIPIIVIAGGFFHENDNEFTIADLSIESIYSEYLNREVALREISKPERLRLLEIAHERLLIQEVISYEE